MGMLIEPSTRILKIPKIINEKEAYTKNMQSKNQIFTLPGNYLLKFNIIFIIFN